MISDGQCDWNLFIDDEEDHPRCGRPGRWYKPDLLAGAGRLTWCDEHRHGTDIPVPAEARP